VRYILSFVLFTLSVSAAAVAAPHGFTTIDAPGASATTAWSINVHGDIVGTYFDSLGVGHGFLLRGGVFTTIDFPGAANTAARGINSRGDIVGNYRNAGVNHGYLLSRGVFTTIDFPGADTTPACGQKAGTSLAEINLFGDIVGAYSSGGDIHGFLLSRGTFTTIAVPPGATCTHATGISTDGDIVGWFTDASLVDHGFLRNRRTFTTIDVPGYPDAAGFGIDPSGTFIVGIDAPSFADINGLLEHGFLLTDCGLPERRERRGDFTAIDFPEAGVTVTEALGVDDQGDIVGDYIDSLGVDHGFLFRHSNKGDRAEEKDGR
jgi:hypothetical protein